MTTLAEKVFNFILQDTEVHKEILSQLPPDKREAVVGRKGRLIITGPEGGNFCVRLTTRGIFREDNEDDVRNEILMSDDTLLEIIIWAARDPKDPGIDPRSAYANRYIQISGDRVLYDAEEIFSALEQHAFQRMQPIAKLVVAELRKRGVLA